MFYSQRVGLPRRLSIHFNSVDYSAARAKKSQSYHEGAGACESAADEVDQDHPRKRAKSYAGPAYAAPTISTTLRARIPVQKTTTCSHGPGVRNCWVAAAASKASIAFQVDETPEICQAPVAKQMPTTEETPTVDATAIVEKVSSGDKTLITPDTPVVDATPTVLEASTADETPTIKKAPVVEEVSTIKEPRLTAQTSQVQTPIAADTPIVSKVPFTTVTSSVQSTLAVEQTKTAGSTIQADQTLPTEESTPVEVALTADGSTRAVETTQPVGMIQGEDRETLTAVETTQAPPAAAPQTETLEIAERPPSKQTPKLGGREATSHVLICARYLRTWSEEDEDEAHDTAVGGNRNPIGYRADFQPERSWRRFSLPTPNGDLARLRADLIRIVCTRNMSRAEVSIRREIFHREAYLHTHKGEGGSARYRQVASALTQTRGQLVAYKRRGFGWLDLPREVREKVWKMVDSMECGSGVGYEDELGGKDVGSGGRRVIAEGTWNESVSAMVAMSESLRLR